MLTIGLNEEDLNALQQIIELCLSNEPKTYGYSKYEWFRFKEWNFYDLKNYRKTDRNDITFQVINIKKYYLSIQPQPTGDIYIKKEIKIRFIKSGDELTITKSIKIKQL